MESLEISGMVCGNYITVIDEFHCDLCGGTGGILLAYSVKLRIAWIQAKPVKINRPAHNPSLRSI